MDLTSILVYALPMMGVLAYYTLRQRRIHRHNISAHEESVSAGLIEPASLHPVIDEAKCLGCGACVRACPEQPHHHVLGLINGKAALVGPTECIGHGACKVACPFDAITLVFGTERRGVDIPVLKPNFESNVPGIYVAGELGGMGLIRNALMQGQQAVEAIAQARTRIPGAIDLFIVGAGPAGLAGCLAAKHQGLDYVAVEQESLGGAVFQYPRGKLVMTSPVELPIVGKVQFKNTTKEELLQFWTGASKNNGLNIRYRERVESITRLERGFRIKTTQGEYTAATVLLALGRRGTPRKLGVTGEELPKVVYRLIDPEQYRGKKVVVVGGGDSALEAAASIAELGDTEVVLSYRGDAFQRAKTRNRQRVEQATASGQLKIMLKSQIREIQPDVVILQQGEQSVKIANDAVIVNAGGILPNDFLKSIGIDVETKWGTA